MPHKLPGYRLSPERRLRVLLSAYACEPGKGSEPGVGWHWALQAARYHDVWVLTRANNRAAIEAAVDPGQTTSLRFHYYDLPAWALRAKLGVLGVRGYYALWQRGALAAARRLHRQVGFDVVHHVTFNSMDVPGWLWRLGPPFVWGPVGGGQETNPAFRADFGNRWWREQLRTLRKRTARYNPIVRAAVRRAAAVLVANGDTARQLPHHAGTRWLRELETAVDLPLPALSRGRSTGREGFTILWVGGLIPLKAPRLALDVLAELKRRGIAFRAVFVGQGELAEPMRDWVRELGLAAEVELVGRVPYSEMERWYSASDAFLFTGLHDTSGNVILEAMAQGVAVVTLDQHGAGEMVDAASGLKVRIAGRAQVVADLASALARLAGDPELRRALGRGGRERVERDYTWARKGDLLRTLYAEVTDTCLSLGPASSSEFFPHPSGSEPAPLPDAPAPRP